MARRKKTNMFGNKGESIKARKRLLLWVSAVLASVSVLVAVAWYQGLAYMQSARFQQVLETRLGEHFGAERVAFNSPLHIDGERVSEDGFSVANAGSLKKLQAGRVSMEVDRMALLGRRLNIRKISVEEAELLFEQSEKQPAPKSPEKVASADAVRVAAAAVSPAASSSAGKKPFFSLQSWQMETLECKDTEMTYRRGGEDYSLQGCTVTTTPLKKGGWQHAAENGRLHTPFAMLRGASVRSAIVQQDAKGLSLTDCRIMLYPGEMRVRAHQDAASQKWSATLAVNKASIAPLLQGDWKKRASGELYGKATLMGEQGAITAGEGNLSLQEGVLEALPFLSDLPAEGGYPYRHLELDRAECRLSFPYAAPEHNMTEAWLFDNINIRAKNGLLRVKGHVIVGTDGALGGTLTIGLPRHVVTALPMAPMLQGLFNAQGEEGYMWLNINLSGTLETPEEDLSVRCAALMQGAMPASALQAAATAEQMFRALLNPQKPASKTAEPAPAAPPAPTPADALNAAADGVQQGINSALKLLF